MHRPNDPTHCRAMIESLEPRRLLSGDALPMPRLVRDVNTLADGWEFPDHLVSAGPLGYFIHSDGLHGRELWRSDGTPTGTFMLRDMAPGPADNSTAGGVPFNGHLFFIADDGGTGHELWKTDGSIAGTTILTDLRPGPEGSLPRSFSVVGDRLFFWANDGVTGWQLWSTDGSAANTRRLTSQGIGSAAPGYPSAPMAFASTGTRYFFPHLGTVYLHNADGSPAGSFAKPDGASPITGIFASGEKVYFFLQNGSLWASDGTTAGTRQITSVPSAAFGSKVVDAAGTPYAMIRHASSSNTVSIWRINPENFGTSILRPGGGAFTDAAEPVAIGDTLFFTGTAPTHGRELMSVTAGQSTASLVRDNTFWSSDPRGLYRHGDTLYFGARSVSGAYELWRSDGTFEGTQSVGVTIPGPGASSYSTPQITSAGQRVLFANDERTHGREVWSTLGTFSSTMALDVYPGTIGGGALVRHTLADKLIFESDDGVHGRELWTTDGTASGTRLLKDINPGAGDGGLMNWYDAVEYKGRYYFTATQPGQGSELWATDGTEAGTQLVKDINPGEGSSLPMTLNVIGDLLYFYANDGTHGRELWRTDGTAAGTRLVADVNPGPDDAVQWGGISQGVAFPGQVLFVADNGTTGEELFSTDGTPQGTTLLRDIYPGGEDSEISELTRVGGTVFFRAIQGGVDWELWKTDGTPAGTTIVRDIAPGLDRASSPHMLTPFKGLLYFNALGQLWKSDGTEQGTVPAADLSAASASMPRLLRVLGDHLIFIANVDGMGNTLWASDGTAEGTRMLVDPSPDTQYGMGENLLVHNGRLYFAAGSFDTDLWVSDGTPEGTRRLPEPTAQFPDWNPASNPILLGLGGSIFFMATDGVFGHELWTYDLALPGDADGDRRITAADYFAIDRGRATRKTGFSNGDFNHSGGPPNADDYMIIDRAFLIQSGQAAAPAAAAADSPQAQDDDADDALLSPVTQDVLS